METPVSLAPTWKHTVKDKVEDILNQALARAVESGALSADGEVPSLSVELPRNPEHGDFACAAMALARTFKTNPRAIAEAIVAELTGDETIQSAEIAGPGFINLRLKPTLWFDALAEVHAAGEAWGRTKAGAGKKVNVEFVSANPTGPLHVGHGRGAVTGDVVSTLLDWAGWDVTREYYVNDHGNQVHMLTTSVYARYQQHHGRHVEVPEDGYQGDYIMDVAVALTERDGKKWLDIPEDEWRPAVYRFSVDRLQKAIEEDLAAFNIHFDVWKSERSLYEVDAVSKALAELESRGHLFTADNGATLFRSSDFGDDKDRAVIKEDGNHTYLAGDIAYHWEKLERGFDWLIDVWGADHAGYTTRMRGAIEALGRDPKVLDFLMVQIVSLTRGGEPIRMGKRSGEFVTLREVIDEIGRDATRFFFIMRRSDSQFEFDLDLAKKQSNDNPVFYVQYGHARIASILRRAEEQGVALPDGHPGEAAIAALGLPEEIALARRVLDFPNVVEGAADALEPHRIVFWLQETIAAFHSYYTRYKTAEKVVSDDVDKTAGRLFLVSALRRVLENGLTILGVSAPDRMERPDDADPEEEE